MAGNSGLATVVALFNWESVRWLWLGASAAGLLAYFIGRAYPRVTLRMTWLWGASIPATVVLLYGVWTSGPLQLVGSRSWGGFIRTLVLAGGGVAMGVSAGGAGARARAC